jgi:uncharacterized protein (DUF433 family)
MVKKPSFIVWPFSDVAWLTCVGKAWASSRHCAAIAEGRGVDYFASMTRAVISRDPDVMGGTPAFRGTRVPVQTLIEYLAAGETIDDFLEGFPSVTREQVIAFLARHEHRSG